MTIETIYTSDDGISFFTEDDCLAHEQKQLINYLADHDEITAKPEQIAALFDILTRTHNITKK